MDRSMLCVVCEIGKPPYEAQLTWQQMSNLIGDSLEWQPPKTMESQGHGCPLPEGCWVAMSANALCMDDPPAPNRFGTLGHLIVAGRMESLPKKLVERAVAAITEYDRDQLSKSFRIPSGVSAAPAWEKKGMTWEPDVHVTPMRDDAAQYRLINALLAKYGDQLVACWWDRPYPVMESLQLQFSEKTEGRNAANNFLREYQASFTSRGRLKAAVEPVVKRLLGEVE